MDTKPIGSLSIRPPKTTELEHLDPILHGKAMVAEWKSGLGPKHTPPVKLSVASTDRGRRFYLNGCLNGWSYPKDAVHDICSLGLKVAEATQRIPPDQLDRTWIMLLLNIYLMPSISELRTRSYDWGRDFRAAAKDKIGQMLAFQLSDEPKPEKRTALARDPRLNAAAENVFPKADSVPLISRLALYITRWWRREDQMAPERIRQAVISSVLAGDLQQDEVKRASQTRTAEALVARVIKISKREKDELLDTLIKLKRRGFNDIARSLKIPKNQVRRDVLSLMASTFWDLAVPWTLVMGSIRSLVRPRLSTAEITSFDRLYLPQAHVANLPPYLLWPRRNVVIDPSLMLLDTPTDEAWRLNAIPWNLEAFAELDDATRRADLERRGGWQRQAPAVGGHEKGEASDEWFDMQPEHTDDSAPIDPDVLKRVFARFRGLPCPKCDEQVQDLDVSVGTALQNVIVELSPCGCAISASDLK